MLPKVLLPKITLLPLISAKLMAGCVLPKLPNIYDIQFTIKASPLSRYDTPRVTVKAALLLGYITDIFIGYLQI